MSVNKVKSEEPEDKADEEAKEKAMVEKPKEGWTEAQVSPEREQEMGD